MYGKEDSRVIYSDSFLFFLILLEIISAVVPISFGSRHPIGEYDIH